MHMKAIGLYTYLPIDDPESLIEVELPKPRPTGRDLLAHVKAVSVNPVDTEVRAPKPQREKAPRTLGWGAAGIVAEVGGGVTQFNVRDEAYYSGSIIRPGCDSKFHLVDERIVGRRRYPEREMGK
jgi:NADPH:quinone reductase-like Zn-dependent oxidoreductase